MGEAVVRLAGKVRVKAHLAKRGKKIVPIVSYVRDPNLSVEARTTGDRITVGPKFDELTPEQQAHVLRHEQAHQVGLDDAFLSSGASWDLKRLIDVGHLNGQTTPGEIVAEAYAVLWDEPEWLDAHAPELRRLVESLAASKGLKVP